MCDTDEVLTRGIYAYFRETASRNPSGTALWIDGHTYTYQSVVDRVEACVRAFRTRGFESGDVVAIALPNSLSLIIAVLATFAVRGVVAPLNPRFTPDELRQYLQACGPRVVLHSPELSGLVESVGVPVSGTSVDTLSALGDAHEPVADAHEPVADAHEPVADAHEPVADARRNGMYMFSSGSTGRAKRVTRSERQVLEEYLALRDTIELLPSDRVLCTVPLFHAHGFCNAMLAALLSGGQLLVLTGEFHARTVLRTIEQAGVTIYPTVPFMLKMLVETRLTSRPVLPDLRVVISAGAPLPESIARVAAELFGVPVSQLYGSTETGALTINYARALQKPGSVGRPLAGFRVETRREGGVLCRPHEEGEVWVRTPSMTQRYDGLPELSAQCFVDDWFATGDLGYVDEDRDLFITGRRKLLINVAGFKVDPLEVERVLADYPGVRDVVVVGVQDDAYGEQVKAVVAPGEGAMLNEPELIAYVRRYLAEYKVPKILVFCPEIPRSPMGKVLRKYL